MHLHRVYIHVKMRDIAVHNFGRQRFTGLWSPNDDLEDETKDDMWISIDLVRGPNRVLKSVRRTSKKWLSSFVTKVLLRFPKFSFGMHKVHSQKKDK